MDRKDFEKALAEVRKVSPKRKFDQSIDLIVTFKALDLKKPDNQVDAFITLPHERGKKVNIAAFVQTELRAQAKENCDTTVHVDDFPKLEGNKPAIKKLINAHDFFIAQATIMPQVAKAFGRLLGPRNKMPNPKAGCVVPPNAQLKSLVDRLKKTVRILLKLHPVIQLLVGKESMKDEDIIANTMAIFNGLVSRLPGEQQNIRKVMLKTTMGPSVAVGVKEEVKTEETKEGEKKEETKPEKKKEESKEQEKSQPKEEKEVEEKEEKVEEKVEEKKEAPTKEEAKTEEKKEAKAEETSEEVKS